MDKEFIAKKVFELRDAEGISARKLSLNLGLSNSYILQVESGAKTPSFDVMLSICSYYGITLAEFFAENSESDPKEGKLLSSYRQLGDQQQDALIAIADTLVVESKRYEAEHGEIKVPEEE